MSIKKIVENKYFPYGVLGLWLVLAFLMDLKSSEFGMQFRKWSVVILLILISLLPIWGLTQWKKNTMRRNYEWIGTLVFIIIIWCGLLYFIGPKMLFNLE
jgi:hypothetical protein